MPLKWLGRAAQPIGTVMKSIPSLSNETERRVTNETNALGVDPSPRPAIKKRPRKNDNIEQCMTIRTGMEE